MGKTIMAVDRKRFLASLKAAFGVAAKSTPKDVLKSVLMEYSPADDDGEAILTATDLESAIRLRCPVGHVRSGGPRVRLLLPPRVLSMFETMTGDEVEIEIGEDRMIAIESGSTHHSASSQDPDLFPDLFATDGGPPSFIIDGPALAAAMEFCSTACEPDSTKYAAGILIAREDGRLPGLDRLIFVGCDQKRAAEWAVDVDGEPKAQAWPTPGPVIRKASASRLARIVGEGPVSVFADDGNVRFRSPSVEFLARIVEGKFPDHKGGLPAKDDVTFSVPRDDLARVVAQVFPSLSAESLAVSMAIYETTLEIEAKSEGGISSASMNIDVNASFDGRFNLRFWSEALRSLPGGDVSVGLTKITKADSTFSCAILRGEGWMHVIAGLSDK